MTTYRVAVLVALAERLRAAPVDGLRVLLVSCGAEEVIRAGLRLRPPSLRGAGSRPHLVRDLETLGSPTLMMLEGEGPVVIGTITTRLPGSGGPHRRRRRRTCAARHALAQLDRRGPPGRADTRR